jgi:hypothetical protein
MPVAVGSLLGLDTSVELAGWLSGKGVELCLSPFRGLVGRRFWISCVQGVCNWLSQHESHDAVAGLCSCGRSNARLKGTGACRMTGVLQLTSLCVCVAFRRCRRVE